ncbi:membrane-bound serine protease (ClpP class) [Thioalkalivibrio sp. ALE21]|uniref:NfeD family protein n=1 Tax=Thioalkalivibrio sp. ALE21 TaxID=1158175 RepID=UPI000D863D5B|nr:nodulation protein NfeD [Thioalkalivibrio sp. ALE21]PYG02557.1 membrane-bound serine protease (ClpP class) [Thioalkalivibrio sp. ALE21]
MIRFRKQRGAAARWLLWLALLIVGTAGALLASADNGGDREAVLLTVDGAIGPATVDYITRGIDAAEERGAEMVVLQLDTPGGLDSSMRSIIKHMLQSGVPVVTYVHPAGARAASAGTYMLYGSHVAAMTPATNLGSATPVQMGGGGLPGLDEEDLEEMREDAAEEDNGDGNGNGEAEEGRNDNGVEPSAGEERLEDDPEPRRGEDAMERKVLEDAVSYIRGLAERYDRNADWAEETVREGSNLTATDALNQNVIDFVADNLDDLLQQIDGHTVKLTTGERELVTEGIRIVRMDPDWRTELLSLITNPNIAYILMLIGIYGIIFELANPGAVYPGVIGSISLILAFFALQVMPINYAGLALMLLGMIFMIAEAFVPSFGALGIGGLVAFMTGSVILWDDPNLNVALPLVVGTAIAIGLVSVWVLGRLFKLRGQKPATGHEEMIGMIGHARADFEVRGPVWVHSELWTAETTAPVREGQKVRVTAIEGLRLTVEPVEQEGTAETA